MNGRQPTTFRQDLARGQLGEREVSALFPPAHFELREASAVEQQAGLDRVARCLWLPRPADAFSLEVKTVFGDEPGPLIELSTTGGASPGLSGLMTSAADWWLFWRRATGQVYAVRREVLLQQLGEWLSRPPLRPRDNGARTARHCVSVSWRELEQLGRVLQLQPGKEQR